MAKFGFYITVIVVALTEVNANRHFPDENSPESFASKIEELLNSKDVNISSQCEVHLEEYNQGLLKFSIWAFKMFDASSKLPTGILEGHFADLGAFDECINIDAKMEASKNIYGQYCLGTIPIAIPRSMNTKMAWRNPLSSKTDTNARMITPDKKMGIQSARCVPHSCSIDDINQIYSNLGLRFYKELCQTKSSQPDLDPGSIATMYVDTITNLAPLKLGFYCRSFFGVILVIMLISTAYDAVIQYFDKKPHHIIFIAFSILTNGKKLTTTSDGPNQISCLHGIRVISTMWVILGHRFAIQNTFPVTNHLEVSDWMSDQANMYLLGAPIAVDTFFLMGGLVIAYGYMSAVTKGVKFNIFLYYIHRYLRLTPVFAVIILIHITLLKHFGSGPLWPFYIERDLASYCEKYWWKALLYIQNYGDQSSSCVPQSWYLNVDMQLFVLSPILLIPLSRWPKITLSATGFLTACSIVTCFLTGWFFELNYHTLGNQNVEDTLNYTKYYYGATQTRAAPWLIGFIAGYFIFQFKRNNRKLVINKILMILVWAASLAVLCTCVFAGHDLIFREYDRIANSMHLGFVRPAWAVAVCSVIYLCVIGYGGPINWFLSLPVFQVISKFTYTQYLVHYFVIYITTAQMRDTPRSSSGKMMYVFWGDFAFTTVIAVILTLSFESPIITIEKILFGGKKKEKIRRTPNEECTTKTIPTAEA